MYSPWIYIFTTDKLYSYGSQEDLSCISIYISITHVSSIGTSTSTLVLDYRSIKLVKCIYKYSSTWTSLDRRVPPNGYSPIKQLDIFYIFRLFSAYENMGFSKGHRYSLPIFTWTVQRCLYIKSINSCTKMDPNNKLKEKN